jgi:hypothetical protein
MKLEFLEDISDGDKFPQVVSNQLVRLFDFDPIQSASLRDKIAEEILNGNRALNLSSLDFIEPINCNLTLIISKKDEGLKTQDKINFECALTIPLYQQMIQLIGSFCDCDSNGYQWLYDLDCEIDLLFSPGGTW